MSLFSCCRPAMNLVLLSQKGHTVGWIVSQRGQAYQHNGVGECSALPTAGLTISAFTWATWASTEIT